MNKVKRARVELNFWMLVVSQTETANKNKILKPEEIVKKVLHTLRDHHNNDMDDGPLVCYINSLTNSFTFVSSTLPAWMFPQTAYKENFKRG